MSEVSDELKKLVRLLDSNQKYEPTLEEGVLKFIWKYFPSIIGGVDLFGEYMTKIEKNGLDKEAYHARNVRVGPSSGYQIMINTNDPSFEAFKHNVLGEQASKAMANLPAEYANLATLEEYRLSQAEREIPAEYTNLAALEEARGLGNGSEPAATTTRPKSGERAPGS